MQVTAELCGPLDRGLKITSTYEYLEARFSLSLRLQISIVFIVQTLLYIAIVIYGPALALETVTGLGRWEAVWISGAICIFYTTIGGLKAVVWTDTFQIILMLTGFLSIIIDGAKNIGFDEIIRRQARLESLDYVQNIRLNLFRSGAGGRLIFDDFSFDPTRRHSFWSITFGGTFGIWGCFFCVMQSYTQRLIACRNMNETRIAVYWKGNHYQYILYSLYI